MRLTPNNPNSVATVVQYGYTADNLNMTVTGFAEVRRSPSYDLQVCHHGDSDF